MTTEEKRAEYTVFVVDDEQVIAATLATILRQNGFDAHVFFSAEEALQALPDVQPDLLLSDVMMPGMNGVRLAIQTRKLLPDCKILLFSGQASTSTLLHEARMMGHDFELILKPIHPSDLLVKLRYELANGDDGIVSPYIH